MIKKIMLFESRLWSVSMEVEIIWIGSDEWKFVAENLNLFREDFKISLRFYKSPQKLSIKLIKIPNLQSKNQHNSITDQRQLKRPK
jgi:hypothetical protein